MGIPIDPSPPIAFDTMPAEIPSLYSTSDADQVFSRGDTVWYYDKQDRVLKKAVIMDVNPGRESLHEDYDIEFVDGQRRNTMADRLRKDAEASARTLNVELPDVPTGTYAYKGGEERSDGHWTMKYGKTDAPIVIMLLVDHNPECPKRRAEPLRVSMVWMAE